MKSTIATLTLGAAAFAAVVAPAAAQGYRTAPGIKVMGAGAPVPAPVPVPDMPALWYVSLSAGYAFASSGDIKTKGPDVGARGGFDEIDGPANFGFAAGRHIWGGFRGEVDFTFRPKQKITKPITSPYTATTYTATGTQDVTVGGVTRTATTYDVRTYNVAREEETRNANQTAMLNLFYDIPTGTAFTPYIGGGLGIGMRQTTREYKDRANCTSLANNVYTDPFTGALMSPVPGNCGGVTAEGSGSKQTTGYHFAGALMAGVAYQVSRGVVFDLGYRYLLQDLETTFTMPAVVGPDSTIKLTERGDHEVRATVRFNLD